MIYYCFQIQYIYHQKIALPIELSPLKMYKINYIIPTKKNTKIVHHIIQNIKSSLMLNYTNI